MFRGCTWNLDSLGTASKGVERRDASVAKTVAAASGVSFRIRVVGNTTFDCETSGPQLGKSCCLCSALLIADLGLNSHGKWCRYC